MQRIGEKAYNAEQIEKRQILNRLLSEYNDGRKKTLFCVAVNLLPLEDLRSVFEDGDDKGTYEYNQYALLTAIKGDDSKLTVSYKK